MEKITRTITSTEATITELTPDGTLDTYTVKLSGKLTQDEVIPYLEKLNKKRINGVCTAVTHDTHKYAMSLEAFIEHAEII